MTPEMSRIEYGLRLDCAKQGCDPPHEDNGRVFFVGAQPFEDEPEVNGHAATWVKRMITAWEPAW